MSKIVGIDGMTFGQLDQGLRDGGQFVYYTYTVSILIMTFKRPTSIYYIAPGESAMRKGLPWLLISLLLGWWGIPWGPIYTFSSIGTYLGGGEDVTNAVFADLMRRFETQPAAAIPEHNGDVETSVTPPQPA